MNWATENHLSLGFWGLRTISEGSFYDLCISIPFWIPPNIWELFLIAAILLNSKYSEIKGSATNTVIMPAQKMLMVSLWMNSHNNNNSWTETGWKVGFSRPEWVYSVRNAVWPQRGYSARNSSPHLWGQSRGNIKFRARFVKNCSALMCSGQ